MTHPGTILTTHGKDGTDAGPRSLVLALSGQVANHKEHKERKAGSLGKGWSSPARGWVHFPNRLLLFVLSAFSVVELLRSVLSVPSVVRIFKMNPKITLTPRTDSRSRSAAIQRILSPCNSAVAWRLFMV